MRNLTGWLLLAMLVLMGACSTGSTYLSPAATVDPARQASFELLPDSMLEAGDIALKFDTASPERLRLSLAGTGLRNLRALYGRLRYDPQIWAPGELAPDARWGAADSLLKLAVEREPGVLDFGIVLANWEQRSGVSTDGVLAQLSLLPAAQRPRAVRAATEPEVLTAALCIERPAGILTWPWRMTGDYDCNGEVNIADMTPLGKHLPLLLDFGGPVPEAYRPLPQVIIDGDLNGEINLADLTPIGFYYGLTLEGYRVYRSDDWWRDYPRPEYSAPGMTPYAEVGLTQMVAGAEGERPQFRLEVDEASPGGDYWWVAPFSGSWEGEPSNSALETGLKPARLDLSYGLTWDAVEERLTWENNLLGDMDRNGEVSLMDLMMLTLNFMQNVPNDRSSWQYSCDCLRDGIVTGADAIVLSPEHSWMQRVEGYAVFAVATLAEVPADRFAEPSLTPVLEGLGWSTLDWHQAGIASGDYCWIQPWAYADGHGGPRSYGAMSEVIQIP